MLTAERNELLTRVGPGTAMGDLLRRYWWPVATAADLEVIPSRRVRLLGEDLVLYRDGGGRLGLLEEQCPHRRASLAYGIVEPDGIRCGYHGWKFDHAGRCLDQPGEPADSSFKERIRTTSYVAEEMGGLVWAYLGPKPASLLPRYDVFAWDGVFRDIGEVTLPVNFLQIMENTVDPHHVEWLHGHYFTFLKERRGVASASMTTKRHVKIGFDVFEHGIIKRRLLEGQTEDSDDWKVGHPLVFPHMLRVGSMGAYQAQIRVPLDDTHTWHLWYTAFRPSTGAMAPQGRLATYAVPYLDDDGNHLFDFIDGQDIMAWVTQGTIADRTREHLGKSDLGVILLRRLFMEQMAMVERGEDPLGVIRDPERNRLIELPQERDKFGVSEHEFISQWMATGSLRYSPQRDAILALFAGTARGAGSSAASHVPQAVQGD
jgi:5,5'-dehydrodivanillate O-demethylase